MNKKLFYRYYGFKEDKKVTCSDGVKKETIINRDKIMFEQNYMWASLPLNFNDPYDCALHIACNSSKIINEDVYNFINKKAVICFCENNNNMLMWSHYADSHKGICVGYDFSKFDNLFKSKEIKLKRLQNVNYTHTNNIDINVLNNPNDSDFWAELNKLFYTKSTDWAYENEWRVILEYDKEIDKSETGRKLDIKLNEIIKEVVFGVKCNEQTESFMKENFSNAKFKKATLDSEKFQINIIDI